LEPRRVDFATAKEKIIDLACGFNSCIALNENKQVYVWGKKMGIYPPFEFNLRGIEQSATMQLTEIN